MRTLPLVFLLACSNGPKGEEASPSPTSDTESSSTPDADADGDGSPAFLDCDDNDAARTPGGTELSYDGFDNNCDPADDTSDYDVDGDGSPGLSAAEYQDLLDQAAIDHEPLWGGEAPFGAEPHDCRDYDAEIHPDAVDEPYDGVDANCDRSNDYDADGDGYIPSEWVEAQAEYVTVWAYEAELANWAPAGSDEPQLGDCLDTDLGRTNTDGDAVAPDSVHPGAPDAPYDGVDSDCARDNDFDADGDGYMPVLTTYEELIEQHGDYIAAWGFTADQVEAWGEVELTDCDDEDPAAHPRASETVFDSVDSDCDGHLDSSPWSFGIDSWKRPSPPKVTRLGDQYVILASAKEAVYDVGGVADNNLALAMMFPIQSTVGAEHTSVEIWKFANVGQPMQPVIDVATDWSTDTLWAAAAYTAPTTDTQFLMVKPISYNAASASFSQGIQSYAIVSADIGMTHVDVLVDDAGEPQVVGCDDDTLLVVSGSAPPPTPSASENGSFGSCHFTAVSGDSAVIETSDGTGLQSYEMDGSGGVPELTSTGFGPGSVRGGTYRDGLLLKLDDQPGVAVEVDGFTDRLLAGLEVVAADAIHVNGTTYVVGITDPADPRIVLSIAALGASETVTSVPWEGVDGPISAALEPVGVGLHVDADGIALAVTAIDSTSAAPRPDRVGWMFLQP